jgi:WD40 repeat protein
MQPLKIFTIKKAISKVKYIGNDKIVVVDIDNAIRVFDLNELKLDRGFKINLPQNRLFADNTDISSDGNYLALTIQNKNKAAIWNIQTKKLHHLLGWHKGEVESVKFDNQNKYVATGGTDGRTHLWNIQTGKMVGSFAPHADYVTAIGFSKNSLWCATGSYDKSISITNISSMKFAYKLRIHSSMITKIKFLHNFLMISGDRDGNLICSNYSKGKVLKRFPKLPDVVVDFCFDTKEKFMFATTKNKNIYLYNLETFELITDQFLKLNSIVTSLEFIPELMYLIIGTTDGILYIYDVLSDEKQLEEFIQNKEYANAYELINQNPILKDSLSYTHLEKIWENSINKAQKLLEKSEQESAQKVVQPFMSIPAKRLFIQTLFKDFAEFDKFKQLIIKRKYPLAYSLANRYPTFKQTTYYKHMEKEFKKAFTLARQLMFDKTKEEYIKNILMPFRGVPEKTALIQSLANEKEIYKLLKQKMAKRDFKGFFELINRYPFLANLDEYSKTIEFGEKLKETAQNALKEGNYSKVLQYIPILENFPMLVEDAKELKYEATILANFMKIIANKEYDKVYEYIQKEPFLEELDIFKEIERKWLEKIEKAEEYSARGDVKAILDSLGNYMKIKDKLQRIGELIKSAYLYQILEKLKTEVDDKTIERGFRNYIKIFGLDLEISDLITLAKKSGRNLDFSNLEEGDKINWHKKEIPYDIFKN